MIRSAAVGILCGYILGIGITSYLHPKALPTAPSRKIVGSVFAAPLVPFKYPLDRQTALDQSKMLFFGSLYRLEDTLPDCEGASNVCIIRENRGGSLYAFEFAAWQVTAGARSLVVIDGYCASGCVIFADHARDKVCITAQAEFHLHKGKSYDKVKEGDKEVSVLKAYFDPPHSTDILTWVAAHGGFPETTTLSMSYAEAKTFWRTCELHVPLPKPRPAKILSIGRPL